MDDPGPTKRAGPASPQPQLGPVGVDFGPREGLRSLETQAAVPGGGSPSELRKAHTGLFGAGATWPEVGILCDLSWRGPVQERAAPAFRFWPSSYFRPAVKTRRL